MAKFNRDGARVASGRSAVQTTGRLGAATTYEGAPAYVRDAKGELFQLAVVNMVSEQTFYEDAGDRDRRFRDLIWQVAAEDPEWLVSMVTWLRGEANMRSASVVMAAELARAVQQRATYVDNSRYFIAREMGPVRRAVDAACQRADEPGELLGYWMGRYGRSFPKGLKRGLADAVTRLYTEYTLLKYDTPSHAWRFADVIDLVHPVPSASPVNPQSALFKHALDRRHGREIETESLNGVLPMVHANHVMRWLVQHGDSGINTLLDPDELRAAGMTWEDALSLAGNRLDKAKLWEALIPTMGYMALLRNLRNFDQAGISDEAVTAVCDRLADRDQVARSRQFPYRFLSAYASVDSDRWREALRRAVTFACYNIPALPGRTLVAVDTSGSMQTPVSARSSVSMVRAAAMFGAALAVRGQKVDLYGFANGDRPFQHTVNGGSSALYVTDQFCRRIGEDGHGTNIAGSVRKVYDKHDRVIIITDMQTFGRDHWGNDQVTDAVPAHVPMYAFNLGGYRATTIDTRQPNRHELGGLTDATFKVIPLLERGTDTGWPWEA